MKVINNFEHGFVKLQKDEDHTEAGIYCGDGYLLNNQQAERCAELLKQIMIAVKEGASVELVIVPKSQNKPFVGPEAGGCIDYKRAAEVGKQMSESTEGLLTGTGNMDNLSGNIPSKNDPYWYKQVYAAYKAGYITEEELENATNGLPEAWQCARGLGISRNDYIKRPLSKAFPFWSHSINARFWLKLVDAIDRHEQNDIEAKLATNPQQVSKDIISPKEMFLACIELRKVLTGYTPEATFDFTKQLRDLCYGKDEK